MGQVITNDNRGTQVVKLHGQLDTERSNWDKHWDEVCKYVIPRKDNVYGNHVPGDKVTNTLFDTQAILANDNLASALHGMLTSPSFIWFGLATGNKEVDSNDKVREWLFNSTLKTIEVMNQSNFQTEIHEVYLDLGSIGTAPLRIEADEEDIVRYYSEPVYDVVIKENSKGRIDFVSREYEFDGRQVMQEFADDMEPEVMKHVEDCLRSNPAKKFKIIHQVCKRSKADQAMGIGATAYPIKSVHVLKDNAMILRESGFKSFPYAIPRWSKINKETYGRSPAMKTLADIKMVNSMKKVTIQGAQLAIAPPLQVPDNGFLTPLTVKPFGVNYKRAGSRDSIEPLFTGANPQLGEALIEMIQNSIDKHFLLDKLTTPLQDRMTAAETLQRRDESLRFLGPNLGRLDVELLKPVIDRTFDICMDAGVYDPMPAELEEYLDSVGGKANLKIVYRSTIAQAQLIAQAENVVRAVNSTAFVVGSQPEVMDNIDGDKLLRNNFTTYNADPGVLRSENDVKRMRQERQQAMQEQMERQNAEQDAKTIKTMGEAENV